MIKFLKYDQYDLLCSRYYVNFTSDEGSSVDIHQQKYSFTKNIFWETFFC